MELPRYVSELECHPHRMVTLERLADFTLRGREEEKIGTPVFGEQTISGLTGVAMGWVRSGFDEGIVGRLGGGCGAAAPAALLFAPGGGFMAPFGTAEGACGR